MSRILKVLSALLFFALLGSAPAAAQSQGLGLWITANCGTLTNNFPLGFGAYLTETQTGLLCTNAGGSGSSNVVITPSGAASSGIVPIVAGPSVNSAVLKAAPGNFYGLTVTPTSAVYIFVINATSLPANATLTPGTAAGNLQECVGLAPANLTSTFDFGSGPTEVFSTGITVALSSTPCPVLTASAVGTINGRAQ